MSRLRVQWCSSYSDSRLSSSSLTLISAPIRPLCLDQLHEIVPQVGPALLDLCRWQLADRKEPVHQPTELVPVLRRDTEQLADHQDRQREGERLVEVCRLRPLLHRVQQIIGYRLSERPQQLYAARSERPGDQATLLRVLRRVAIDLGIDEQVIVCGDPGHVRPGYVLAEPFVRK